MLFELSQVGKREDLQNMISRVDARSKPFLAMCPKGDTPGNILCESQMDDFEDATDSAVLDGTDVASFDNASPNRALVYNIVQTWRESAMVSDAAENVSNVAGLAKGELAESIMKKLEKLSRNIEAALCSDNEMQRQAGQSPNKLRGLGKWIGAGASQTLYPVPTNFETPAGSLDATAMASVSETIVNNLLESSWNVTGKINEFALLCGSTLKRQFSAMSAFQSSSTNVMSRIRAYNSDISDRTISSVIDRFEGDFGNIELHPTAFNAKFTSAAASSRRGYGLIMSLFKLRYYRLARVQMLENKGGGPRFFCDAGLTLQVANPKPLFKMSATT